MKTIIHRGSGEIGGTCIQLSTDRTTILLDLGLPLSQKSKQFDLESIKTDAVLISHPHQDGYLKCSNKKYSGAEEMAVYRRDRQVNFVYAHTSGHATVEDLQSFSRALKPKMLVPIHTEHGEKFKEYFENVKIIKDEEVFLL